MANDLRDDEGRMNKRPAQPNKPTNDKSPVDEKKTHDHAPEVREEDAKKKPVR